MYANFGAIRIDVLMPVIRNVQKQERSLPSVLSAKRVIDASQRFSLWCVHLAANLAIELIRRQAKPLESNALILDGARAKLYRALVEGASPGPVELLEPLQKLHVSSVKAVADGRELVALLRALNPHSRVALEVERVNGLFASIDEASLEIIQLIEEGQQHTDSLAEIREANAVLCQGLADYDDAAEVDPELMELAQQAIESINSRSKSVTHS